MRVKEGRPQVARKRKTKKKGALPRRPSRGVAAEYRFRIDAYTPDTMPMARLAEYLAELATVLGEPTYVHLVRLEPGSTVLVHQVEREAVPKVRDRATSVRRGRGPRDAVRAYHAINKLLREDDGVGVLQEQTGAEIIRFPGREETEEKFAAIRQYGSIDGEVLRVGGPQKYVPVMLQSENEPIAGCYAERTIAKELARKLFEPVRVFGRGRWNRDADGKWSLDQFIIQSFEPLRSELLSEALGRLRAIPVSWGDDAYGDLQLMRHGPEKQNGGA
jgi:hypothetical protein